MDKFSVGSVCVFCILPACFTIAAQNPYLVIKIDETESDYTGPHVTTEYTGCRELYDRSSPGFQHQGTIRRIEISVESPNNGRMRSLEPEKCYCVLGPGPTDPTEGSRETGSSESGAWEPPDICVDSVERHISRQEIDETAWDGQPRFMVSEFEPTMQETEHDRVQNYYVLFGLMNRQRVIFHQSMFLDIDLESGDSLILACHQEDYPNLPAQPNPTHSNPDSTFPPIGSRPSIPPLPPLPTSSTPDRPPSFPPVPPFNVSRRPPRPTSEEPTDPNIVAVKDKSTGSDSKRVILIVCVLLVLVSFIIAALSVWCCIRRNKVTKMKRSKEDNISNCSHETNRPAFKISHTHNPYIYSETSQDGLGPNDQNQCHSNEYTEMPGDNIYDHLEPDTMLDQFASGYYTIPRNPNPYTTLIPDTDPVYVDPTGNDEENENSGKGINNAAYEHIGDTNENHYVDRKGQSEGEVEGHGEGQGEGYDESRDVSHAANDYITVLA